MGLLDRSVRIPPPLPPVAAVFKLQSTTFEIVEVMDSSIKSEYRAFTVQEPED